MIRSKYVSPNSNQSISIFVDGPTNGEINHYNNVEIVHGYTFNPTLFRQLKVANYFEHCNRANNIIKYWFRLIRNKLNSEFKK